MILLCLKAVRSSENYEKSESGIIDWVMSSVNRVYGCEDAKTSLKALEGFLIPVVQGGFGLWEHLI